MEGDEGEGKEGEGGRFAEGGAAVEVDEPVEGEEVDRSGEAAGAAAAADAGEDDGGEEGGYDVQAEAEEVVGEAERQAREAQEGGEVE